MTEREVFLNHLAEASGRARHQLVDHPFAPINALPATTLSDLSAEELLDLAQNRSVDLQVDFQVTPQKKAPASVERLVKSAKRAKHFVADRP